MKKICLLLLCITSGQLSHAVLPQATARGAQLVAQGMKNGVRYPGNPNKGRDILVALGILGAPYGLSAYLILGSASPAKNQNEGLPVANTACTPKR